MEESVNKIKSNVRKKENMYKNRENWICEYVPIGIKEKVQWRGF